MPGQPNPWEANIRELMELGDMHSRSARDAHAKFALVAYDNAVDIAAWWFVEQHPDGPSSLAAALEGKGRSGQDEDAVNRKALYWLLGVRAC